MAPVAALIPEEKIACAQIEGLFKLTHSNPMQTRFKSLTVRNSRLRSVPILKGRGKPRPHYRRGPEKSAPLFNAGETVKETGIYEVVHDRGHRTAHEVVLLAADSFPACDSCGLLVRFRLVRTAPYIFQDEDFEESQ